MIGGTADSPSVLPHLHVIRLVAVAHLLFVCVAGRCVVAVRRRYARSKSEAPFMLGGEWCSERARWSFAPLRGHQIWLVIYVNLALRV